MNEEQQGFKKWFNQLKQGVADGIAASPEDRRENLTAIRELEGKAEGPRGLYTLFQNPIIDAVRQNNTVNNNTGLTSLGLPQFTDDSIIYRANKGLMVGPSPEQLVPEAMWVGNQALPVDPTMMRDGKGMPLETENEFKSRVREVRKVRERNLEIYKHKLANLPALTKAGQAIGALGADISQDTSRGLWWLINASQAVVNLGSEGAAALVNPDLFGARPLTDLRAAEQQGLLRYIYKDPNQYEQNLNEPQPRTKTLDVFIEDMDQKSQVRKTKLSDAELEKERNDPRNYVATSPGVKQVGGGFKMRRFNPNLVNVATMLPAALGVNAGIGLLGGESDGGLGGRKLGYEAVIPDEDDPTRTSNPLLAAGTKYFLGREGQILPWDQGFNAERPDVSRQEYNRYKDYERSRAIDLNPFDDGIVNLGGVLKANLNDDAVHGKEIQFLGKNLDLNTTIIPTVTAIAGGAVGGLLPNLTRIRRRRDNPHLRKHYSSEIFQRDPKTDQILRDETGVRLVKPEFENSMDEERVDKYRDPRATRITKIMGNFPEIAPRNRDTGLIDRPSPDTKGNRFAENKTAQNIEQWFMREQQQDSLGRTIVGPDELHRGKVLGTVFGSGLAGLAAGSVAGSAIEEQRRKRNFEENSPGIDYESFKNNARKTADRQREIIRNNPNRKEEREQSKAGFNSRAYQQSLLDTALQKQAVVDTVADLYIRKQLQEPLDESIDNLVTAGAIEKEINERYQQRKDKKEARKQYKQDQKTAEELAELEEITAARQLAQQQALGMMA